MFKTINGLSYIEVKFATDLGIIKNTQEIYPTIQFHQLKMFFVSQKK